MADRTNRRIQVFDTDGKFLRMFTIDVPPIPGPAPSTANTPTGERLAAVIGAPNSMCITPGPNQVLFIGESTFPGRIFKVSLDGKGAGSHWPVGPQAGAIFRRTSAGLSFGKRSVCRGNFQLACAETDSSSGSARLEGGALARRLNPIAWATWRRS